jgi:uncharacterized protein YebE (UPF0316 family)
MLVLVVDVSLVISSLRKVFELLAYRDSQSVSLG